MAGGFHIMVSACLGFSHFRLQTQALVCTYSFILFLQKKSQCIFNQTELEFLTCESESLLRRGGDSFPPALRLDHSKRGPSPGDGLEG